MKKIFTEILSLSIVFLVCISCAGQNQNTATKIDKKDIKPSSPELEGFVSPIEIMPRFPGCEGQGLVKKELEECAKNKMLTYIYENLEYPEQAKKKGIEGRAIIQFKVDIDGSMKDVKLIRDLEEGCGKAALKVIKKMQAEYKWIPELKEERL